MRYARRPINSYKKTDVALLLLLLEEANATQQRSNCAALTDLHVRSRRRCKSVVRMPGSQGPRALPLPLCAYM